MNHPNTKSLALAAALLFAALAPARAAIPPAEKLLPADTLFVLSVPDCATMGDLFQKSPQAQLWQDPAMKPFREKFLKKWQEEIVVPLERELNVKLQDYRALLRGQFTLAATLEGWDGKNDQVPAVLLLLDAREKSGLLQTNLAGLRRKWLDSGKSLKTEKVRGVEFSVVTLSSNDLPKGLQKLLPRKQEVQEVGKEVETKKEAKTQLVVGQHESLLIVSSSLKAAEKVLLPLTGGSAPTLADQPLFEANQLAVFRGAPLFGWVNTRKLFEIVAAIPMPKPNPEAPRLLPPFTPAKIVTALGLSGLNSLSLAYRDQGDGCRYELFLNAPESTRQGVVKLLAPESKDSNPPPFVPADVVKFQRWRVDLQKTVATIEKTVNDISPDLLSTWNFLLNNANEAMKQQEPDFDIRKNLLGQLGDDILVWEKSPRGNSLEEIEEAPSLILVGSPAPEKLAGSLKAVLALMSPDGLKPKEREFLGRKILAVELPGRGAGARRFSYVASGSYVAMGTDAALIEEFLRSSGGQAKPLREIAGLTDAAQRIGGQNTGYFGYENQVETMRVAFEILKKIGAAQSGPSQDFNPLTAALPFARPESSFKEWMDFSLLPEYAKVSKYFHFAVYSGQANAEGISYKFFGPNPPQKQPSEPAGTAPKPQN